MNPEQCDLPGLNDTKENGESERGVKSKTQSKARNSLANSGDAFAPARTFSKSAVLAS